MKLARILTGAGVVVAAAAALYGYAYYKYPPSRHAAAVDGASAPASPPAASTAAAPPPAVAASPASLAPTTLRLYDRCVQGGFPTLANADRRNADCSAAIQTRELSPDQLALARLIRGSARMALGDKVLGGDDYSDALKRHDSMLDSRNPEALNLFRRAAAEDALGNTEKALDLYGQAIRLDSNAALAFLGRGVRVADRKRAYERGIEDFDKVLALEPDNVLALIRRGEALGQLGETGRGLVDLDRAIALSPSSSLAYLHRGLIHNRRNEQEAALRDYDAAVQRGPHNAEALTNRAALYSITGKLDLAIRDLDAAVAIDRQNPAIFFNRGYAHFANGEYEKAIADYTTAIGLDENFGTAYNNRCLARTVLGKDLPKALADCDVALRLLPLNLDVHDTRGFIYLKLGDPALALNEYNAALNKDPDRAISLFGLGLAKVRSGNVKDGEADKAAARIMTPDIDRHFSVYGVD